MLGGHAGICHAEFAEALSKVSSKVRSIQFPAIGTGPDTPDERFQRYFSSQKVPGTQVQTGEEAVKAASDLAVA